MQKYLSADRSALNYSGHVDRKLDTLYDQQAGELDRGKRIALLREFERQLLDQAYVIPTIWWHRIIVSQADERLAPTPTYMGRPGRRLAGP